MEAPLKTKRIIVLVVAASAIILVGLFLMSNLEKKVLDDAARAQLGGSYVRLSKGVTHYALEGPEDGPVVVLVHGGTIPMFTWDELSPILTAVGFRVLRTESRVPKPDSLTRARDLLHRAIGLAFDALDVGARRVGLPGGNIAAFARRID